jgi:predicted nucleic-acid-binding Zn-ribbon protein
MPEMADILRTSAPEYLAKYGADMLPSHKRAIEDIILCRTRPLGGKTYFCEPCDEFRYSYHSCKNRSCPKCGNDDANKWLAAQNALLLPVQYFMVTSTLPDELRPVARKNQKLIYGLLLRMTAEAVQKLARDPEWVGGNIGLLGVLQTWKRDMGYHVHAHFIVPGGGLSPDGKRWLPAQRDFLMPNPAVASILRGKFRDALKKTPELFHQVPKKVWQRDWVVDIKPVGKGNAALKYLTPYIFRVAISNKRIEDFQDGKVTFRYQDNKGKWHRPTLEAEKFISRFLQHVLPYRFVKVRYYGFLSPRKRHLLEDIKELFALYKSENQKSGSGCCLAAEVRVMRCPKCGSEMVFVKEIKPVRGRAPPWTVN